MNTHLSILNRKKYPGNINNWSVSSMDLKRLFNSSNIYATLLLLVLLSTFSFQQINAVSYQRTFLFLFKNCYKSTDNIRTKLIGEPLNNFVRFKVLKYNAIKKTNNESNLWKTPDIHCKVLEIRFYLKNVFILLLMLQNFLILVLGFSIAKTDLFLKLYYNKI